MRKIQFALFALASFMLFTSNKSNAQETFLPWKYITTDDYVNVDSLEKALKDGPFKTNSTVLTFIRDKNFVLTKEQKTIGLCAITPKDLGLKGRAITYQQLFEAAEKNGLKICSPEFGPELRLAYTDQPKEGCVLVPVIMDNVYYAFSISNFVNSVYKGPYISLYKIDLASKLEFVNEIDGFVFYYVETN